MGTLWKSQEQAYKESLSYLKGRKEGQITSLVTPWTKVNEATVNGLEWHSMTVIGGRPGSGKTLMKDQIIRSAFDLNPGDNFRVLEFSLEMLAKNSAIRSYSAFLGRSYKYLCSADGELSDADFQRCVEYAKQMTKHPIDVVEAAPTVREFKSLITDYMMHHSTLTSKPIYKEGKYVGQQDIREYKNTVITLDHSILVRREKSETTNDMLFALGEAITALKRKYPIIFIILSQLNRNIDAPERNEDGKYGNYVLESDIFGADAMLQHADTVIGINRPGKQRIRFYGPERYIIEDMDQLVMHFLKCRYGEGGLAFFKAEFEKMSIAEGVVPPTQETRSKR